MIFWFIFAAKCWLARLEIEWVQIGVPTAKVWLSRRFDIDIDIGDDGDDDDDDDSDGNDEK